MIVKLLETGEIQEVENLWGERLIEQGAAVPAPAKPRKPAKAEVSVADKVPAAAETKAEEPKAETKKAGKKR